MRERSWNTVRSGIFFWEKTTIHTRKGCFGSIPSLTEDSKRLHPIEGLMPDPTKPPKGCWFAPRCKECTEKCRTEAPPVWERDGHQIRCHQIKSDKEVPVMGESLIQVRHLKKIFPYARRASACSG